MVETSPLRKINGKNLTQKASALRSSLSIADRIWKKELGNENIAIALLTHALHRRAVAELDDFAFITGLLVEGQPLSKPRTKLQRAFVEWFKGLDSIEEEGQ